MISTLCRMCPRLSAPHHATGRSLPWNVRCNPISLLARGFRRSEVMSPSAPEIEALPRWPGGRLLDPSGFEVQNPIPPKIRRKCRPLCSLNLTSRVKRPPAGTARNFGKECAGSGVVFAI
ncbi:hypothetical protein AVEN_146790-1 [Araneus ventricosus]|uniref:Uncharacterized protein n=1 Tax=Araneus ventricosus TaxID=182803 RepID=A0A4Y2D7G4_ARAVE|nr:hypothetical protein AVEN_146790-1 [Araneus ventricosus]